MWDSRRPGVPGVALRPSRLGRWNGIAYYARAIAPVAREALQLELPPGTGDFRALGWLLVASTLFSMLDRARSARGTGSRNGN